MEVSTGAKARFCKDCNLAIRLFQEPYFTERLKLYDKFFNTMEKWERFTGELEKYGCEQDYFEEYNRVKDAAISSIKDSDGYKRFNQDDMGTYSLINRGLSTHDIFHDSNDKGSFISIDMKKANFSSLRHYDPTMFGGAKSWEEFMKRFTSNQHIVQSKYVRQVILGNCNPKRQVTYEKFLMDSVLSALDCKERVIFFSNDEIVLNVSDMEGRGKAAFAKRIQERTESQEIPLRIELFTLHKIGGTHGFCKKIYKSDGKFSIELKGLDNFYMPFVLRKLQGEEVTDSDRVFYHQGLLSKFMEIPEVTIDLDGM